MSYWLSILLNAVYRSHFADIKCSTGMSNSQSRPYPVADCCRYERLAWIPVLIVYIVALGIGGKHLINPPPAAPADAPTILSFASTIAGFVITYAPLSSDFTTYFKPEVSRHVQIGVGFG